jgi:O-antigen chain-terminating methyltransferase
MTDMTDEMTGPRGIDAQVAIEQLRALVAELQASRGEKAAGRSAAASDARLPAHARSMMDWLRADLTGRYFGTTPNPYVEVTPLGEPPAAGPDLHAPDPGGVHVDLFAAPSDPVVPAKDSYALAELLGGHREAFVRNAFRAILGRDADPEGFAHFEAKLATGSMTRLEALADLRYSPEGRARRVRIAGLRRVRIGRSLRRVPVVGALLAIAHALLRLPGIARRLEWLEYNVVESHWEFNGALQRLQDALREVEWRRRGLAHDVDAAVRTLDLSRASLRAHALSLHAGVAQLQASDAALRRWAAVFGENLTAMDLAAKRLRAAVEVQATRDDLKRVLEQVIAALAPLVALPWEVERQKGTLALIEAGAKQALLRVNELEQRHARDIERVSADLPSHFWTDTAGDLDDFYADFENRFRGTFEDIKGRVAVYVPRVQAAIAATGPAAVLDIGSGRGEWLEVLRENGIAARGVDTSATMAREARARQLEVAEGDGLDYLRKLPAESQAVVTAFHVVEHLQFPVLIALVRECLRVLKPGGMVIFETPNPENLVVGSHTFWYDPTHLKPLPPDVMQFAVASQGFTRPEIVRLHPNEPGERIPDEVPADIRDRLNALLYGPRDYSVVAYKPLDKQPTS